MSTFVGGVGSLLLFTMIVGNAMRVGTEICRSVTTLEHVD